MPRSRPIAARSIRSFSTTAAGWRRTPATASCWSIRASWARSSSAVGMQALMAERNGQLPADRVMHFVSAIHMGDVMADEDEAFGDGVNIAVRLEAIAAPGGVAVSAKAYHEASKHLSTPLVDAGMHRFKNIAEPVHVWTWEPARSESPGREGRSEAYPAGAVSNRDRGSAAVRQPQRQRRRDVSEGLTEDLIHALSLQSFLSGAEQELDFRVQGQEREHAADRARNRRHLPDPGIGATCRKENSRHRRVDRSGERRAIMGRPVRQGHRRPIRVRIDHH